jgi:hypothetical protein
VHIHTCKASTRPKQSTINVLPAANTRRASTWSVLVSVSRGSATVRMPGITTVVYSIMAKTNTANKTVVSHIVTGACEKQAKGLLMCYV